MGADDARRAGGPDTRVAGRRAGHEAQEIKTETVAWSVCFDSASDETS
eukprot:SAG11_NODE_32123_length_286_cov_0.818182_1_plen_47_part_01